MIEILSYDIRRREITCPPLSHPPSLRQFGRRSLPTSGFFGLHTISDAPCTWLLIMTWASAVLSHVISRLLMSCDNLNQTSTYRQVSFNFPIKFQNQKNLFNNLKNFNSEVFFHLNSCYFICSKCHLITCMFVIDVSESLSDPVRSPNIDICNVFLSYRLFNTSIGLRGQLNSYRLTICFLRRLVEISLSSIKGKRVSMR